MTFIYKLFETFYINYTVGQEAWTPKFQHMMNIIREKYNGQAPEWFRKAFRTKSLPLMKYTNMLSFNTPGDRFVCQPFHRHALAVFRIRADRIKLDVALYDQKA